MGTIKEREGESSERGTCKWSGREISKGGAVNGRPVKVGKGGSSDGVAVKRGPLKGGTVKVEPVLFSVSFNVHRASKDVLETSNHVVGVQKTCHRRRGNVVARTLGLSKCVTDVNLVFCLLYSHRM